ncbi:hypothetical protein AVEN_9551-1 [Araneus ventricosus]|uniref:Uncharacterized protein n=1 Tax=Araneus ventricosus TaxID=182803 RepID=A0A4Y2SF32_ARAVE|nr:hypothetical protein AVEN_251311-1 [Araneus ventricosus]GBN86862.1 hypothetical protein AVEN_9551-1 [Araneus ventricosus]
MGDTCHLLWHVKTFLFGRHLDTDETLKTTVNNWLLSQAAEFYEEEGNCVRRFVIPAVNFGAADYADLIDWQAFYVTPPPVLRHIGFHELQKMIQDDVPMNDRDFNKFPSHTQAVERIVKLVTEASRKRVGPLNRDGFIRATLESRKQMSQFESKKDFKK